MVVYHEVRPSSVEDILREGLRRSSRGEKGQDELIERADRLLDDLRPEHYRAKGVSCDDNIYAYVEHDGHIIDITDGSSVPTAEFIARSQEVVLQLEVGAGRCYVSDLDQYDTLKKALADQDAASVVEQMAQAY